MRRITDQLIQVILDARQVGQRTDGHQAAEDEVKHLVAEEWDEPPITVLWTHTHTQSQD